MTGSARVKRRAKRRLELRLYIAGSSPNSLAAQRNLRALCAGVPDGKLRLEVVDVFDHPRRALADGILVTPTLVRLAPAPVTIVVGDLSDHASVRAVLDLPTAERVGVP